MCSATTDSSDNAFSVEARHDRLAGWGRPPHAATSLAERLQGEFERVTGRTVNAAGRPAATRPEVPERRVTGEQVDRLARIAAVRTDDDARRAFSLGKSYPDLVAARSAALDRACDLVVQPRSEDELDRALAWLVEHDVAVVPVGGGSTVVGGIEPLASRPEQPVAALDMTALATCLDVDACSSVAIFQAGIRGPDLESVLGAYDLTLGHVPQSFELSSLGGWIATRSAGQQSLAFGKIEKLVAAMRISTPNGVVTIDHLPAHGAGPGALELMLGSEGTLGVITRATMRVVPRPTHVRFSTFVFPSFAESTDAARTLVQRGLRPAVVRVSDPAETGFSVGSSVPGYLPRGIVGRMVRAAGYGDASMVFVITPGTSESASALEAEVERHMRDAGGRSVGATAARQWYRSRFVQPYVRDLLMDRGLLVDTLETSAPWHAVSDLHRDVRAALTDALGADRCIVGCHISHLYVDGASLYFTFIADPDDGVGLDAWRAAKRAVHDAIARHRAATSHQHGVGTMHADLYAATNASLVTAAWRAARGELDPTGVMNPGKCFVPAAPGVVALNAVRAPGTGHGAPRGT